MSLSSNVRRGVVSLFTGVLAVALISALAVSPAADGAPVIGGSVGSGWNSDLEGGIAASERESRATASSAVETSTSEVEPAGAGVVSGRVLIDPDDAAPFAVSDGLVQFYDGDAPYELVRQEILALDGTFAVSGLLPGDYRVAFVSFLLAPVPVREWNLNKPSYFDADLITLENGPALDLGDIVLEERNITTDRIAGANRFGTAAAVSDFFLDTDAGGDVFIVNGLGFPDALSAGAAATNGSLLMVSQNSIPAETQAELTRIDPDRIVIVGGPSVVSSQVQTQLQAFVSLPSDVVRISGADRYATSRAVITSPAGLGGEVSELLIATGRNFPDALSAVPAAIVSNGAVLLVNGTASTLDAATIALVENLDVPVTIIGGPGAVSAGIQAQLQTIVPTSRVSGTDRFATSVAVAQEYFEQADFAFITNGLGFADALAAGPLAGKFFSPVYLVKKQCVPLDVYIDVFEVLANEIIAVGGASVVSNDALDGLPCDS